MDSSGTSRAVRAFVAVAVPRALLDGLRDIQRRIQSVVREDLVRWSKPEQVHLTLKFLGDVPADRLDELKAALNRACEGQEPFQLVLEGIGCFPNPRNPRVVWVGLRGDQERLLRLQRRIAEQTRGFGDHIETRAFQPHLTIGRLKAEPRRAKQVGEAVEQTRVDRLGDWTVSDVELMQSELSPAGARYTKLATVELLKSAGAGAL